MDAREAAKALIRRYVERGDSYEHLKGSWLGSWNGDYHAGIGNGGSTTKCQSRNPDSITVSWVDGQEVCCHFSLKELYEEIKAGVEQPRLF